MSLFVAIRVQYMDENAGVDRYKKQFVRCSAPTFSVSITSAAKNFLGKPFSNLPSGRMHMFRTTTCPFANVKYAKHTSSGFNLCSETSVLDGELYLGYVFPPGMEPRTPSRAPKI